MDLVDIEWVNFWYTNQQHLKSMFLVGTIDGVGLLAVGMIGALQMIALSKIGR